MEIYITKLNTISMMESLATWTGHYSAQSGKLSNICFLTGYQTLIGQRTFFRSGVISGNLPRSRDNLRHYLRPPKIEVRQFSNLIIPSDIPFKCDYFL